MFNQSSTYLMKLNLFVSGVFLAGLLGVAVPASGQLTPQQAIAKMTRGINLGRCMDMPNEGDAQTIQEYYFDDFTNAGFNFVRVPVQWDKHTGTNAPYTVDTAWLDRVQQVVNWGLKRGLIIIINSHHDRWILEDASYPASDLERFKAIWAQASDRLKTNSPNLIFEIANEPMTLSITQINQINAGVIPLIRSNNPTRIIIYSGNGWTSVDQMKAAARPNDTNIMATFHSYDPDTFAISGTGTWGTAADKQAVTNRFNSAATWSQQYNLPVLLGEWGTVSWCDAASRQSFITTYAQQAARTGVAPCIWHDFGNFAIYYPNNSAATRWSVVKDWIMTNTLSGIAITSTNIPPTLNPPGNVTIYQSSGQQTVNLNGISSGASNEIQTLTVSAVSSNPGLIPTPVVTYTSPNTNATLTFTPVPYLTGSATITVTVNDAQVASNLVSRAFTVTVNPLPNLPFAITAVSIQTNAVNLSWASTAGKLYAVEYSLNLQAWSDFVANIPAVGTNTSCVLNLASSSTGTNDLLVQYQMGQAGPQIQDATNGVAGGNLTAGSGATLCNVNATVSPNYASQPELQVGFSTAGTDLATAVANQTWFKFTLTAGQKVADLDLARLSFNAARGGTNAPRGFGVYVTTPTTTNELVQGATDVQAQRATWGTYSIDLTGISSLGNLTNGQAVTFKIPVYSPSTISSLDFDNLAIYGKSTFVGNRAVNGAQNVFFRVRQ
jgi:aryl-phospho-beta-D-glucosidase BglC (GH1 family)